MAVAMCVCKREMHLPQVSTDYDETRTLQTEEKWSGMVWRPRQVAVWPLPMPFCSRNSSLGGYLERVPSVHKYERSKRCRILVSLPNLKCCEVGHRLDTRVISLPDLSRVVSFCYRHPKYFLDHCSYKRWNTRFSLAVLLNNVYHVVWYAGCISPRQDPIV